MPIRQEKTELSLIFVNFRSVKLLSEALRSVSSHVLSGRVEVIVVNNDVTEADAIRDLSRTFPLRLMMLSENNGFGQASNEGAAVAVSDILGFLNPDTVLIDGSLEKINQYFKTHPDVGVIGASLVTDDGRPEPWSFGMTQTLFGLFRNKLCRFPRHVAGLGEGFRVEWVSGAAMFVRTDLFRRLHGFDEEFFLYFEDMDLCERARQAGASVTYVQDIVFRHHGGATQSSRPDQKRRYYASQDRYFAKHRPKWEGRAVTLFRGFFTV